MVKNGIKVFETELKNREYIF